MEPRRVTNPQMAENDPKGVLGWSWGVLEVKISKNTLFVKNVKMTSKSDFEHFFEVVVVGGGTEGRGVVVRGHIGLTAWIPLCVFPLLGSISPGAPQPLPCRAVTSKFSGIVGNSNARFFFQKLRPTHPSIHPNKGVGPWGLKGKSEINQKNDQINPTTYELLR